MDSGPIVIGFDGSPAATHAVRDAARLLGPRRALVVAVWEEGRAFEFAALPIAGLDLQPTLDARIAAEADHALYEQARKTAQHGAALATEAGFDADALVVADELTVADTLVRVATEQAAPAIVVGTRSHSAIAELLLGSTTRGVLKHAPCPVVVIRGGDEPNDG